MARFFVYNLCIVFLLAIAMILQIRSADASIKPETQIKTTPIAVFGFNDSNTISAPNKAVIKRLVDSTQTINAKASYKVISLSSNHDQGKKNADKVAQLLLDKGIKADRITITNRQPLATDVDNSIELYIN